MATAVVPIRLAQRCYINYICHIGAINPSARKTPAETVGGTPSLPSARGTTTTTIITMRAQAIIGTDHGGTTSTLRNGSIDELYALDFASGLRTASYAVSKTARKA